MSQPLPLNPRIVEVLYCEALVLSDEVRHAFTPSARSGPAGADQDVAHVTWSNEGLRTTTQMMHAIAWLLNHRAFFLGHVSQLQLHRHGRLSPELGQADNRQLEHLTSDVADLVGRAHRFYERLLWLDGVWRLSGAASTTAIERLRERIEQRLAG